MTLSEKTLLAFCKKQMEASKSVYQEEWDENTALFLLKRVYSDFLKMIQGRVICDFGCGGGFQTIALAKNGARKVVGIESDDKKLQFARELASRNQLADRTEFYSRVEESLLGQCDIVISQNSMEHFPDPALVINIMKSLLRPKGILLITFGPPWFAPYGSHMQFFTNLPWINLLFSEKTVMNVRKRYRNDGAVRYEDVESGLNKMSVGKFEKIMRDSGLQVIFRQYECVKGLNPLGGVPLLRELFINHISCSFVREGS